MPVEISAHAAVFAAAALFGGMVFFPIVVAPTVFRALDPSMAGTFLRTVFPAYYLYVAVTALLSALAALAVGALVSGVLLTIGLTTLIIRQILVPRINAWRDAQLHGDRAAGAKFAAGHRLSVVINLIQIGAAGWSLWVVSTASPA